MNKAWTLAMGLATLTLSALAGGCNYNIEVTTKDSLADKSVEVELVGVNETELRQWANYSMTKYWSTNDPVRVAAEKDGYACIMNFGHDLPNPQVLKKDDKIWDIWKKRDVKYIFVLAYIPGTSAKDDKPGDLDLRRKILPRETDRWEESYWGMDRIKLEVSPAGVTCLTRYKPVPVPD